jgi:hypothetical protein
VLDGGQEAVEAAGLDSLAGLSLPELGADEDVSDFDPPPDPASFVVLESDVVPDVAPDVDDPSDPLDDALSDPDRLSAALVSVL